MSQADAEQAQAFAALVVAKYDEMLLANFCAVAATTLLFYDYVVTFSREIRCIWGRKFTWATVLFVLNRYLTLLNRILMIVDMLPWQNFPQATADKTCESVLRLTEVITLILELVSMAFTSLRLYAIWEKDRRIMLVVALLGLVPPAINIYYYTTLTIVSTPPPFVGCGEYVALTATQSNIIAYFNIAFAIVSDAVVLVLVWLRTYTIMREISKFGSGPHLSTLLLRDGTIYFVSLLILNIANLIAIRFQSFGSIPALTSVLTSILISRFFLDLREVYLSGQNPEGSTTAPSHMSAVQFASAAGNLGAPLVALFDPEERHDWVHNEDEDEETPRVSDDPLMVGLRSDSESIMGLTVDESSAV